MPSATANTAAFVIPTLGALPRLTTEQCLELEGMLVRHLEFQMAAFGSTLVDYHTLRQIAEGTGDYGAIGHRDCAFQIAEQFGWKIELLPAPANQGTDAILLAPLRFFHPAPAVKPEHGEAHKPFYPVAHWAGGKIV